VECELAGKTKVSEKTCPSATVSTTNPTWYDPGSNPERRGGKPVTNRRSYGLAFDRGNWLIITKRYLKFCNYVDHKMCTFVSCMSQVTNISTVGNIRVRLWKLFGRTMNKSVIMHLSMLSCLYNTNHHDFPCVSARTLHLVWLGMLQAYESVAA
jgi:hypothetical protein